MSRLATNTAPPAPSAPLSLGELQQAIRAADPAALLVSPRILRRVIKAHAGVSGIGLRVPHRKTYVIGRDDLLAIVDRAELDLEADAMLPDRVILIGRPSAETLLTMRSGDAMAKYWRQLFHARVHVALDQALESGRLSDADIRSRVQQIGETEFDEIRSVLAGEDYLLPPGDDRTAYVEFVAVYLELRYFLPSFLRTYFPAIEDFSYIDELLKQDVDGESLLAATRLAGAVDPDPSADVSSSPRGAWRDRFDEPQPQPSPRRLPSHERSDSTAAALVRRADHVSQLGNLVRAAILRIRAARYSNPELGHDQREKARAELSRLARRLQTALAFTDNEADEWFKSLVSLLDQSARGIWTPEARMLYDLQKVCVDHERGIYTLDVLGWVKSLGRKKIKRFLPGQRDVLVSKHLRSAARRLASARLSQRSRSRLAALLQSAVHRAEATLRGRFRPVIERAMDKVKLLPQNPPERVARAKLIDEILDRIVERGFLSMSDLRDALSRNNLKLPDLASVREFFLGDQLLLADQQLAGTLDGVYRAGEVYLRWPQRLSSLAFGTGVGRFFTRYVALPFGGAYLTLEAIQHVVKLVMERVSTEEPPHIASWEAVGMLGVVLLGLLYYHRFRAAVLTGITLGARAARRVLIDWPAWLLAMPWVRWIVRSWPFQFFKRFALKPLVISAVVALAAIPWGLEITLQGWLILFVLVNFVLNSRIGRDVDEFITDWVVHTWHKLRIYVFAALFRYIMDLFNQMVESIERVLYTVDEWLRFRAGERPMVTMVKAVLGFVWFFVDYVIRFCITLIIEPQVNPIKHFPVVTVSHKAMIPLIIALQQTLEGPLGNAWAWGIALFTQFFFPGIAGFLVWELKENWRLYAANRPPDLQPVPIGHHGETMVQFLRPGFRSGTLPKLYARLRRASRKAFWTHNWKACSKQLDGLHHAGEAIRRFVDRELLAMLHESRSWADRSIASGEIRLATDRILIELYCPDLGEESMWLAFEERAGWLVATIHRRGWADALAPPRRHTLASALAGFYKMAGVHLVREQIEARLGPGSKGYEIDEDRLVVSPGRDEPERVFLLQEWPVLEEELLDSREQLIERERWIFADAPVTWRRWVVTWELDQLGGFSKHHVLENVHLLPT